MRIALWTAPIMKFVSHWVVAAAERESSALADFPREQLGPQAQYEDPLDNTREALAGMDTKIPSCFVPTAADPKQEGIFALSCLFLSSDSKPLSQDRCWIDRVSIPAEASRGLPIGKLFQAFRVSRAAF
jgi:hypothetical protein